MEHFWTIIFIGLGIPLAAILIQQLIKIVMKMGTKNVLITEGLGKSRIISVDFDADISKISDILKTEIEWERTVSNVLSEFTKLKGFDVRSGKYADFIVKFGDKNFIIEAKAFVDKLTSYQVKKYFEELPSPHEVLILSKHQVPEKVVAKFRPITDKGIVTIMSPQDQNLLRLQLGNVFYKYLGPK